MGTGYAIANHYQLSVCPAICPVTGEVCPNHRLKKQSRIQFGTSTNLGLTPFESALFFLSFFFACKKENEGLLEPMPSRGK